MPALRDLRRPHLGAPPGHIDSAVARWFGVDAPIAEPGHELPAALAGGPRGGLEEIRIAHRSRAIGRRILELRFPGGALVVLLKCGDEVMIAGGGTALHEGDRLVVLADEDLLPRLRATIGGAEPGDGDAEAPAGRRAAPGDERPGRGNQGLTGPPGRAK